MTVTLVSNATADKASFVYCAEHGLTNMRNGAAVTVVGTMADSTVNGHAAKGSGAAVDSYLSAAINGAVAANQSYACILVGTFTTSTDSSKPALWAQAGAGKECRPKIVGNYASGRKVSASSSYAGLNNVGGIPSDNWTSGSQLSIIVGRNTSGGMAGSINNAATVNGYDDATLRASTLASTDALYFGGSPVVGGSDTAAAGFAVSLCAFFVGVSPEELRTYVGADPWADKIVSISGGAFTLTADQGSYSTTGQTAGVFAGRVVTASQGTYSLTGQDATLLKETPGAFSLTADFGTYTLTGQDASFVRVTPGVYTLTAAAGSYSIVGSDAIADYVLSAGSGVYSISGQDASFIRTFPMAYTLTAEFGSYLVEGSSARLIWSGAPVVVNIGNQHLAISLMRIGL